jgi:hypothetical protein
MFYRMGPTTVRLVTSWQTTTEVVAEAAALFREAVLGQAGERVSGRGTR